MKVGLQLRQSQQLTLTPQLQQAIRLLQLSTLEVNQETERLLNENPFLDRDDDVTGQPFIQANSAAEAQTSISNKKNEPEAAERDVDPKDSDWAIPSFSAAASPDDEDAGYGEMAADKPSMREHLNWQLNMSMLEERDKQIVAIWLRHWKKLWNFFQQNWISRSTIWKPLWCNCNTLMNLV
jgi:RNA polymerase sigma-54 factor